jgi:hypothetical protein
VGWQVGSLEKRLSYGRGWVSRASSENFHPGWKLKRYEFWRRKPPRAKTISQQRYPVLPDPAECPTLAYIYQMTVNSGTGEEKQSIPWLCPPISSMGVPSGYDLEDLPSSHILGSPHCGSLCSLEWDLRQLGLSKNTINSGQNLPSSQKSTHLQPNAPVVHSCNDGHWCRPD